MRIIQLYCVILLSLPPTVVAQGLDSLRPVSVQSLKEIIAQARQQSPAYFQITNFRESSYWAWRAFRANYLPQLVLSGTLPSYNQSFTQITQPDGSILPRFVNLSSSSLTLSLRQNIGATGGTIFASSQLQRVDNFVQGAGVPLSYNSSPAVVGIAQPFFDFNPLRWDKKIEPLVYEESRKQYYEELERISVEATGLFFDLLLAQVSLDIARKNQANSDTIFQIAQGRYKLGKVGEDEVLQLELTLMRAQQEVSQARLDLETSTLRLKANAGLTDNQPLQLQPPTDIPTFAIDEENAIAEAKKNRAAQVAFGRRMLEAERDVSQARLQNGLNGTLFAQFGLTREANTIPLVYRNPNNQQILQIGLTVPIIDWGRQKSLRKRAQSNFERTKNIVAQDERTFEQAVYTQVKQFYMLRDQLKITQKAAEIGQRRYDISKNRYLIGKIGITDLNIALSEKDAAQRSYVQSLRQFWISYYTIRQLTLYDFEANRLLLATE